MDKLDALQALRVTELCRSRSCAVLPRLAGFPTLIAGLWAGTSSSSLTLQTTTTISDVNDAGLINAVNVTFTNLPAGTPAYFQIQVYDSRDSSAADAWSIPGRYAGETPIFTAIPRAAVYAPIWQTSAPVNSTLPNGTFVPTDYVGVPGFYGLIAVYSTIPEPGTVALAGLGAAIILAFRRRS